MTAAYSLLYSNAPKVKRIPRDAMIFINHDYRVPLVSGDTENSVLQTSISSLGIGLGVKNSPGSCNLSIEIPRHKIQEYFNKYRFMLAPMMEVEVYLKGCFPIKDAGGREGIPYYKAFWGVISNVDFSYSGGVHRLSIQCLDILRILQIMLFTQNMATASVFGQSFYEITGGKMAHPYESPSTYAESFLQMTPYQAIMTLMKFGFQNVVLPDVWLQAGINSGGTPQVRQGVTIRPGQSAQQVEESAQFQNNGGLAYDFNDIITYWKMRFGKIQGKLRMYGLAQSSDPTIYTTLDDGSPTGGVMSRYAHFSEWALDAELINNTLPLAASISETNIGLSGGGRNILEIIKAIVDHLGWEFFMNTDGDIDCKPPFFNMEVRNNPIHVITSEEIVSFDFGENEGNVCNVMTVTGDWTVYSSSNRAGTPLGFHINYPSVEKFCIRHKEISRPWAQSYDLCRILAIAEMDIENSASMSFSITIKGRPELKIGYPVYIKPFDFYAYVVQKQTSFTFGSSYEDTLTLTACRFPYKGDTNLKNIALVGKKQESTAVGKNIRTNNYIIYDDSLAFHEETMDGANKPLFATTNVYPVSDENGYELYGGLPYGRQYEITADNSIEVKKGFDFSKSKLAAFFSENDANKVSANNINGTWNPRADSEGVKQDTEVLYTDHRASTKIQNTSTAVPLNPLSLNQSAQDSTQKKASGITDLAAGPKKV